MMMMMMDSLAGSNDTLTGFNGLSLNSPSDPDVDWSVFENADRYLLRDDSAWITRLSKDFWWNLERISELSSTDFHRVQSMDPSGAMMRRSQLATKTHPQQQNFPISPPSHAPSTRKIVGQRSSTGRPNMANIPDKGNFFQNFSSFLDQDNDYNPFQSKISFDNHIWTNPNGQQAIPWQ